MAEPNGERDHVARVFASLQQQPRVDARGVSKQETLISESWRRCVEGYGLEPHRLPPPTILSQTELKETRAPVDELMALAGPELDRLFGRLGEHDYVMYLTDKNGVAIEYRCSPRLLDEARRYGLYPGSVWSENNQGTNGVGTCLHERNALSIVMGDHFSTRHVSLTCTVAPVFAPDGRLEGVLNVSTPRVTTHAVQTMVRKIVVDSARRIESYAFARRHSQDTVVRLSRYEDFSDSASEVQIALDGEGRILAAGSRAGALVSAQGTPLAGQFLERFLDLPLERIFARPGEIIRVERNGGKPLFLKLDHGTETPRSGRRAAARLRTAEAAKPKALSDYDLEALAGGDPRMLANVEIARRVFDRGLPILLTGETGTGKGLFARALHAASRRASAPFVAINCAAIPKELIESELFGYRPGAFTGASSEGFKGRILEANGGTLFLDEIGDMPFALQTRLLQVLSDGELTPIGGTRPIPVDLALISATLHDLGRRIQEGSFREDLYFRLNGVTLALPALRERRDREAIVEAVLAEEAARGGVRLRLAAATRACLAAYFWPGNIRELRHAMRYAAAVAADGEIRPEHLPPALARPPATEEGDEMANDPVERQMIVVALERTGWNILATARLLDVSRSTLYRKIKQYALMRDNGA
ncbi:MAG TPA: sigma-54-dependent Fis family transcriptional regulator [Dongiaceae bacterium]|nr:sigma-54-dependent Fis family transcriptional regulator [Dongiaceae bacterium]